MVHVRFFNPFDSRAGGSPPAPPPEPPAAPLAGADAVPAFREIELDGIGTFQFTQGPEYSVSIDDGHHHKVNVFIGKPPPDSGYAASVINGVLRLESGFGGRRIVISTNPPGFRVTGPHLERITIKGAAKAKVLALRDESLAVSVDGAGDIQLMNLELGRLHVRIGGAGKLEAQGRANQQEVEISGAGSFTGEQLTGSSGVVNIQGAGKAKLNVADQLRIAIGGVGTVVYLGNPAVEQRVGGLGRVRRA